MNDCRTRAILPAMLAVNYRLDIKPRRDQPNVITRPRAKVKVGNIPLIQINDFSTADQYSPKTFSEMDYLSDEYDIDDDKDDLMSTIPSVRFNSGILSQAVRTYIAACKKYKCTPMTVMKRGLEKSTLTCKFVSLQHFDIKAICIALSLSASVERIVFEQNGIGANGALMFSEVIEDTCLLTHITLAHNDLRSEGAKLVCEAVLANKHVVYLDLSGNGLVEKDGVYFKDLIENKNNLEELYLGHNCLMEEGVTLIAHAMKRSVSLKVLDLNWNHIRKGGARAIGEALEGNSSLEKLNLAWNGLSMDGALAISRSLSKNDTIIELDLTCNRLSEECLSVITKGLQMNSSLETLRIGNNSLSSTGALEILKEIQKNEYSALTLLDLGNQEVHFAFQALCKDIQEKRTFDVVHGMVWRKNQNSIGNADENDDETALLMCNPLIVLMECMRLQNYRLLDFFKSLDTDNSNSICIDEICDGVLKIGVPIRRVVLLKLLNRLDTDGNKILNFAEMNEAQKLHKQLVRQNMHANIDYEKTEIGRVSVLLRRIMGNSFIMKKEDNDSRLKLSPGRSRPSSSRSSPKNVTDV